jgi:hypothetical protein
MPRRCLAPSDGRAGSRASIEVAPPGYPQPMASVDPVKNTSGGGYAFEDRVGAWPAAALLAGQAPLDADLGPPLRIDF